MLNAQSWHQFADLLTISIVLQWEPVLRSKLFLNQEVLFQFKVATKLSRSWITNLQKLHISGLFVTIFCTLSQKLVDHIILCSASHLDLSYLLYVLPPATVFQNLLQISVYLTDNEFVNRSQWLLGATCHYNLKWLSSILGKHAV